jgi:hypothetical protein
MTSLQLNAMCPFAKDEIKIVERPLQEVMEHAITLEESERRLTEMIHNYYHPPIIATPYI